MQKYNEYRNLLINRLNKSKNEGTKISTPDIYPKIPSIDFSLWLRGLNHSWMDALWNKSTTYTDTNQAAIRKNMMDEQK